MLALVAERTGHAAAAAVEIGHRATWNPGQQACGRSGADECFLVTVGMKEDVGGRSYRGSRNEIGSVPERFFSPFFESDARGGDGAGLFLKRAAEQMRMVVANG